jgi:hypothetical protein
VSGPPDVLDAQLWLERAIRRRLAALQAVRAASGSSLIAALDEHGEASMAQAHAYRALEVALAADEGVSL